MLSLSIPLHTSCPREFWSPTTCLNSDLHLTSPHTPTQGQYVARDQQPLKTCPHVRTKVKLLMPSLICQSPLQPPAELEELSLVYRYRMWRHAHAPRSRWRNSCVLIDDERNGGRYIMLPQVSYWWRGCSTHTHTHTHTQTLHFTASEQWIFKKFHIMEFTKIRGHTDFG